MRAYALMRHSYELEAAYLASPLYRENSTFIDALRGMFAPKAVSFYRGIGRYPFAEYAECEPGWQGYGSPDNDHEFRARELVKRFLGADDYVTPSPRAFLTRPEQAFEVRAALESPTEYEIVELCTFPDHPKRFLGFDIGYWGGGNFSILSDAIIWPIWHPPIEAALNNLTAFSAKLNDHILFSTQLDAQDYLSWYAGQDWAEKWPEEFSIISVGTVNHKKVG